MRILVVTPYFYPHLGGSERYIEQLYSTLIKIDKSIHVDVLTYNVCHVNSIEQRKGMTIYRIPGKELLKDQFAVPNYIALLKCLRTLKHQNTYNFVNAHTRFFESSWWALLVGHYFRATTVLTDHCADHPYHRSLFVRMIARIIDQVLIPWLGGQYSHITAVSQATKQFLINHGIASDKITVMPNSVSGLTGKRVVKEHLVSFVGRAIPAKGKCLFEEAIKPLRQRYPDVQFQVITGKSHEYVMKQLKKTAILIHPSRHHEGLPTVILEAGQCQCAVVATNVGGTTEVITNGITGILTKPSVFSIRHSIEKLLVDSALRQSLGRALQQRIRQTYTWDHTARLYRTFLYTLQ